MRLKYLRTLFNKNKNIDKKDEEKEKDKNEDKKEDKNKNEEKKTKDEKEDKEEKKEENQEKEEKKEKNEKNEENKDKKDENEIKDENKKKKKETPFIEDEFKKNDTLYSLISDLVDMMNYQQEQGDEILYYSILERIFSNIFFEIETFSDQINLVKHALYEDKLCECIDLFEKNFLSKNENINNKTLHYLYQLQKFSLALKSCASFLKILKLMKSKNIAFDNYNSIYENYFKYDISDSIKIRSKENRANKIFEITLGWDITSYECCVDDKYFYLFYDSNNKNFFKLEKYCLATGEKILEKEFENYISLSILNDYKNNKIDILKYKKENEFELLIINKNDFSIEKKFTIFSPIERDEFSQLVSSISSFYLISEKQIYNLDLSNLNKSPIFNTFIVLQKRFKLDKSYYFILDNCIKFSCSNCIDIQNKTIYDSNEENSKDSERTYFDNYNNILYLLRYMKGKKIIEVNKSYFDNIKLRMIDSNKEINNIEVKRNNNLSILIKDYPNKYSDKDNEKEVKLDPFKHYLDYSNNLESLLNIGNNNKENNEENKYKINKELSENYYSFLYLSMIKYYHFCKVNYFNKKQLRININNNIMFDFVKQMATEEKDFILLYIYVNFIIKDNKEKEKNEKIEQKINWIIKFCLEQEKLSPYLFEILRELYKYNPKYIDSTNIAQDIVTSKKYSLDEQIMYFSIITLNEKKELFIKLLEKFLSIEKQIILSGEENISYSKILYNEVCENFINYFQDIKLYEFKSNDFWEEFRKILEIFINEYNYIINEIIKQKDKNKINSMIIKNSVICQILFLLINILLYKVNKITKKNKHIDFIKTLLKTLIISEKYTEEEKSIEHNIEKEEIIIVQSETSENPQKIDNFLPILPGNIYMEYDLETNYPCTLKINKLPPFLGTPSDIEPKELGAVNNISIYGDNKIEDKNDKINEFKRFKIKFSNYKNDESNLNILVHIRKNILYFILISSIVNCKLTEECKSFLKINNKKEKEKTEKDKKESETKEIIEEKTNKIIKSNFFKDISILKSNKNIINDYKYFDFNLNEFADKAISEEYKNNYINNINTLFEKEEENINIININPSINLINENLLTNDSYKKIISLIKEEFIKKNPWGIINDELLKQIIISIFGIIIYEFVYLMILKKLLN